MVKINNFAIGIQIGTFHCYGSHLESDKYIIFLMNGAEIVGHWHKRVSILKYHSTSADKYKTKFYNLEEVKYE